MIHRSTLALALLLAAGSAAAQGKDVSVRLIYNVTPNGSWEPGKKVLLYVDARRSAEIGKEDIFFSQQFPGTYPRSANQNFLVTLPGVKPNETIIVQGYMCAEGTTDCYPSDKDNPPSCSAKVQLLPPGNPSCTPTFTWSGGHLGGGVTCQASCL